MAKKHNKEEEIPLHARPLFGDWAKSLKQIEDNVMEYEIQKEDCDLKESQSLGYKLCDDARWLISESKKIIDNNSKLNNKLNMSISYNTESSTKKRPDIGDKVVANTYIGTVVGYTTEDKVIVEWPDQSNGKYYGDLQKEEINELIIVKENRM